MIQRYPIISEQRRLLNLAARVPLASGANPVSVGPGRGQRAKRMLGALHCGGWVTSVVWGMNERR